MTPKETKTILLVEDEAIIAMVEKKTIEYNGYNVITALSGEESIQIIESGTRIDLVLMDINLGDGMDGTEAAEIILKKRNLPLIFLSSHTEQDVVKKTEGITSYGYIVKNSGDVVLIASIKMAFRLFESTRREKEKEKKLKQSEKKLRSLFEHMPSGVAIYQAVNNGEDFIFKDFNKKAEEIEQLNKQDIIGRRLTEVFPGVKEFDLFKVLQGTLKKGQSRYYPDALYKDAQDTESWRESWIYKLPSGELVVIYNDITSRKEAEDRLLFQSKILEQIKDSIIATDLDGRITFANKTACKALGLDESELIGKTVHELGQDTALGASQQEILEQTLAHGSWQGTVANYTKSGKKIVFQSRTWLLKDKFTTPRGLVGISTDITDRYHKEITLRENESKLQSILQNMPVLMDAFNAEGTIITWNKECERVTGYSADEIIGNPKASQLLYPDEGYRNYIKEQLIMHGGAFRNLEWDITCKDGSKKTILWSNMSEHFPIPGWFSWAIGIDITKRKETEKILETERKRLEHILKGTNVGTWEWNAQTGELILNERWAEMIGYSLDELAPVTIETWRKFVHPDDLKKSDELLQKHFNGEIDHYKCEARMKHKNGSWIWIMDKGRVASWTDDGRPLWMYGTHQEITERKTAEEELARRNEFGRIISKVSSDFVGLAADKIDSGIERALAALGEFASADRAYVFQFRNGHTSLMDNTHEWCAPDIESHINNLQEISFISEFPWFTQQIKDHKTIHIPDINELPPEAQLEKQYFQEQSIQSVIVVPMIREDRLLGFLGFDSVHKTRTWSSEDRDLLHLVAQTITQALENKRAEEALQKALEVKQDLLKELQHRAKNSFMMVSSMVSLMSENITSGETRSTLLEISSRVNAVSEMYDLLYTSDSVKEVQLDKYLDRVSSAVPMATDNIEIKKSLEPITTTVKAAIPIGIMVAELITNAIKHAFHGKGHGEIILTLKRHNSHSIIEVADNGTGIPGDLDIESLNPMGLKLVNSLALQIDGIFTISGGNGTCCTIEFPVDV